MTGTDLRTQTPVEIDTALDAIQQRAGQADATVAQIAHWLDDAVSGLRTRETGDLRYSSSYTAERVAELEDKLHAAEAVAAAIWAEAIPYDEEFRRRGRWSRFYLVRNANGHIHRTKRCPTCRVDTDFAWLTEYSGQVEAGVVELAGERACTVCFPSAPVDVLRRPSRIELPERKAARLARETKKATAAAAKAAKAITNPDGTPLQVFDWTVPARDVTRRGVTVHHEAQDRYETLPTLHRARGWLTDRYEAWRSSPGRPEDAQRVAAAIAAKEGKTLDQVIAEAKQRAAKRK